MSVHNDKVNSNRSRHSDIAFRAGSGHPCPVCGEPTKGCSATDNGLHYCRGWGRDDPAPDGWKRIGADPEFGHYRRVGDARTGPAPGTEATAPDVDWSARHNGYLSAPDLDARRAELADALGLPRGVVKSFGVGWDAGLGQWTYPWRDGCRQVVAVGWRNRAGQKRLYGGGHPGLVIPTLPKSDPVVYVVEGLSDTMAMTAAGLRAVGRHSASAGADHLATYYAALPLETRLVILGENDQKDGGAWPGRDGAKKVAETVAAITGRPVSWSLPPPAFKDVRDVLVNAKYLEGLPWGERGQKLGEYLEGVAVPVGTPATEPQGDGDQVVMKCLDDADFQVRAVKCLVPGRVPRGKVVVGAGDGATAKSTLSRHLGAKESVGKPALGLKYVPDGPGDVIFLANEDDYADTVIPDLLAEGADLRRVHHIPYVATTVSGKRTTIPFGPRHIELLKQKLRERPGTRLIVIDPIASFVGGSGINDHKANELRALVLDPLAQLAAEFDVTVLVIAHFAKGQVAKAVHKIAGSAAYATGVRLVYGFEKDPQDPAVRLMVRLKCNIRVIESTALRFRQVPLTGAEKERFRTHPKFRTAVASGEFEEVVKHMGRLEFDAPVDVNADALFCPNPKDRAGRKTTRVDECADFVKALLDGGARSVRDIEKLAVGAGFKTDNVTKAKTLLYAEGYQSTNFGVFQGEVWIGFGDPATWTRRPEPGSTTAPPPPNSPDSPDSHYSPESPESRFTSTFTESGESGDSGELGVSGCGVCRRCWGCGYSRNCDNIECDTCEDLTSCFNCAAPVNRIADVPPLPNGDA